MTIFSQTLLNWYDENQRNLPWRNETSPYKIWVSEIILQQTRVNQGWNYYLNFIENFPTVAQLAAAPEEKVLKVWQGLGYYSRARYMHETARYIMEHYRGNFPETYEEIRELKGIGDYTAAAISSIAFNLAYPAVDGNVLRVICRYSGIFDNIALPKTLQLVRTLCGQLMANVPAGDFNQALMEFGAIQCVPKNPNCEICPFQTSCFAFKENKVEILPIKIKKMKIRSRFFHYLFLIDPQQRTIIRQRIENDIWKNLFEFPMVETDTSHFLIDDYIAENKIEPLQPPQKLGKIRHQLTHQTIFASFFAISVKTLEGLVPEGRIIPLTDLSNFPMSKVMFASISAFKI